MATHLPSQLCRVICEHWLIAGTVFLGHPTNAYQIRTRRSGGSQSLSPSLTPKAA